MTDTRALTQGAGKGERERERKLEWCVGVSREAFLRRSWDGDCPFVQTDGLTLRLLLLFLLRSFGLLAFYPSFGRQLVSLHL